MTKTAKTDAIAEPTTIEELQNAIEELKRKEQEWESKLAEAKKAKRDEAIADIIKAMREAGLSIGELAAALGVHIASSGTKTARKASAKKPSAPPKFRNPATGETHGGRGRLPQWLREARDAGRLDEFRVTA